MMYCYLHCITIQVTALFVILKYKSEIIHVAYCNTFCILLLQMANQRNHKEVFRLLSACKTCNYKT